MSLLPKLDFDVLDTYDSRVLWISDASDWQHLTSYQAYMDVTTPARKKAVTLLFDKNKTVRYNSANLNLSCADCEDELVPLPDGLYHFKMSICDGEDFSVEKYHLRTVKLMLELDEILIAMDLGSCNPNKCGLDKFTEIELLVKGAHAHVRKGNINEAMIIYQKALDNLKKLKQCADVQNLKDQ